MGAVTSYLNRAESSGIPQEMLKFVDRVPNRDVPLWLGTLDIAVMPFPETEHYNYYMSPLKLFEYMAAGVPIVSSDLPAIREILRHDENAWLVSPGNPEALGQGMIELLRDRDLAARIARNAKQQVKKYTWKKRAAGILEGIQAAG